MLRGTAKKIFLASKRAGDDDNIKIDKIIAELKSSDKFDSDIEAKLASFKTSNSENIQESKVEDVHSEPIEEKQASLFDIKLLNDIDDRVIRGTLKKIYMSGKKASKTFI